jgi:hypothetical protein
MGQAFFAGKAELLNHAMTTIAACPPDAGTPPSGVLEDHG